VSDGHSTVGRNFLAMGVGEAVGRIFGFGSVVYVTRLVSPDAWGSQCRG
jgi:O-antigen/teichoic acid export membrane protein